MKFLKDYKHFYDSLNEGKNDIKTKWMNDKNFHDILTKDNDKLLNRLINLDYTSNLESDKIGKYVSWLIVLYRRGDAMLKQVLSYDNMEDDYKVSDALEFFDKNKNLFDKKDINHYKTLEELIEKIEKFDEISSNTVQNTNRYKYFLDLAKNNRIRIFYENNNWLIIIPNDKEISNEIAGTKTSWCTARPTNSYFYSYNSRGLLYIFLDKKKNLYPAYQLHIENNEFQNNKSHNINPSEFFEDKIDIFKKLFPKIVDKFDNGEILSKNERKWLPISLNKIYTENRLNSDDNQLLQIFKSIDNGEVSMEDVITKEILGFPFDYVIEYDTAYNIKSFDINSKNIISKLEEELNLYNGVLRDVDIWSSNSYYYNYNDYFDSDEYEYMMRYLDDNVKERLEYLKKLLQYKESIEKDGELYTFLDKYKLQDILDCYSSEYIKAADDAKHEEAKSYTSKWCFSIDDNYLSFKIKDVIDFLEENIDNNSDTLFDIINESGCLEIPDDWMYQNYDIDASGLNADMLSTINDMIDKIEDGDSDFLVSKYLKDINEDLEKKGFKENDMGYYCYENSDILLKISEYNLSDDFISDYDNNNDYSIEDILNNLKLEVVYKNKKTNSVQSGFIKYENISKYLQPMLF